MSGQDRTRQIIEIKNRGPRFGYSLISFEVRQLRDQWLSLKDAPGTVPDFYVIRVVTLLEVLARTQIASLIDYSRKYADRAIGLAKNLKLDFEIARDIQGKIITLGDLISHSVPVNSFAQIIGHFETLLEQKVKPSLSNVRDRWEVEVHGNPDLPIIVDYDKMAVRLARLFEVRHILCHELPGERPFALEDVDSFLASASDFSRALDALLTLELHGLVPLTQSAMNEEADKKLIFKEQALSDAIASAVAEAAEIDKSILSQVQHFNSETALNLLNQAQDKWREYRDAHCDCITFLNRGGTILPLLWANQAQQMTEARTEEIHLLLSRWKTV